MINNDVTYDELTALFGPRDAYVALKLIERSADLRTSNVIEFDCAKRLSSAFDAMRATAQAA